ncbi:MAG: hypothetical protein PHW82_11950 [Bacteroidales bacterium]|nr:hypothetical protein [Bacteroidales bacterium]
MPLPDKINSSETMVLLPGGKVSIGRTTKNYFTVNENGNVGIGTDELGARLFIEHLTNPNQSYSKAVQINVNNAKTKTLVITNNESSEEVFRIWGNGSVNAKGVYAQKFKVKAEFGDYY